MAMIRPSAPYPRRVLDEDENYRQFNNVNNRSNGRRHNNDFFRHSGYDDIVDLYEAESRYMPDNGYQSYPEPYYTFPQYSLDSMTEPNMNNFERQEGRIEGSGYIPVAQIENHANWLQSGLAYIFSNIPTLILLSGVTYISYKVHLDIQDKLNNRLISQNQVINDCKQRFKEHLCGDPRVGSNQQCEDLRLCSNTHPSVQWTPIVLELLVDSLQVVSKSLAIHPSILLAAISTTLALFIYYVLTKTQRRTTQLLENHHPHINTSQPGNPYLQRYSHLYRPALAYQGVDRDIRFYNNRNHHNPRFIPNSNR